MSCLSYSSSTGSGISRHEEHELDASKPWLAFRIVMEVFAKAGEGQVYEFAHASGCHIRDEVGRCSPDLQQPPRVIQVVTNGEMDDGSPSDCSGWHISRFALAEPELAAGECGKPPESTLQGFRLVSPLYSLESCFWKDEIHEKLSWDDCCTNDQREDSLRTSSARKLTMCISRGKGGFDYLTVRNLALLLVIFEEQLEQVAQGSSAPTSSGRVGHRSSCPMREGLAILEICNFLWSDCRTTQQIIAAVQPDSHGTLRDWDFSSLLSTPQVLECHLVVGAQDPIEIVRWMETVEALVRTAASVGDRQMMDVIECRSSAGRWSPRVFFDLMCRYQRMITMEEVLESVGRVSLSVEKAN